MRDRGIGVLLMVLVLSACTGRVMTTSPSLTQPAGPSAVQPAIEDLVDVHGEPINVSSLQGRIAFSSGTSPKNLSLLNASPFPVPNAVIGEGRVERAMGLEPIQEETAPIALSTSRLNRLVRAR